jgi:hypothetical protein
MHKDLHMAIEDKHVDDYGQTFLYGSQVGFGKYFK